MKKLLKSIVPVLLVTLAVFMMWAGSPYRAERKMITVEVGNPATYDLTSSINCRGTLEDADACEIVLSSSAKIVDVNFNLGDEVREGDALFTAKTVDDLQGLTRIMGDIKGDDVISVFHDITNPKSAKEKTYVDVESEEIEVKSPVSGIITAQNISSGAVIPAGGSCMTLSNPDNLQVRARVSEAYIQDIREGMYCRITGDAFRDRTYEGYITKIMPFATTSYNLSGTTETVVEVLVGIRNPDEVLRVGYNAKVKIITQLRENAITVPYTAVGQDSENREFVYVIENNRAIKRMIAVGAELDDCVEILGGLRGNEAIVLSNIDAITDGARVRMV